MPLGFPPITFGNETRAGKPQLVLKPSPSPGTLSLWWIYFFLPFFFTSFSTNFSFLLWENPSRVEDPSLLLQFLQVMVRVTRALPLLAPDLLHPRVSIPLAKTRLKKPQSICKHPCRSLTGRDTGEVDACLCCRVLSSSSAGRLIMRSQGAGDGQERGWTLEDRD